MGEVKMGEAGWYISGSVGIVLEVPLGISPHDVGLRVEAVEATAAQGVCGVGGFDPEVLHALSELGVLRSSILATDPWVVACTKDV